MFLLPQIEVQETPKKGKGVFAADVIPAGAVIGDYLGIVMPSDEGNGDHEDDAVYDMWYSDMADICPEPDDNGVHLLNTSCEPNCAMHPIGRHTILFAVRKIFPGEELTYDYFMGEQESDCEPGTDNCHCGSPLCRGTMYSNPTAYTAWEEYLEDVMEDLPEEPPVAFGEPLPPLDEYPETIEDNVIYPLFGNHNEEPHECGVEMISSMEDLRETIRNTGCALAFPELGIVVEGVMYGGHIVMKHMVESGRASSHKVPHAQAKKLAVQASA